MAPKVILIGDSIRMGYQPLVTRKLEGRAEVWGPDENGGDSSKVLEHLDEWVLDREADLLHLNCGLHDLKFQKGYCQVPINRYVSNIHEIVDRLEAEFEGRVIWATTTPVIDERHQAVKPFDRYEGDVRRYNKTARAIIRSHDVTVNDLHEVIMEAGPEECLREDGVHMTERGNELLAEAVAAAILACLE